VRCNQLRIVVSLLVSGLIVVEIREVLLLTLWQIQLADLVLCLLGCKAIS